MSAGNKNLLTWEEEKAIQAELGAKYEAEAEVERRLAYAAVQRALTSYRWWGITNILNSIRIWVQSWRKHA